MKDFVKNSTSGLHTKWGGGGRALIIDGGPKSGGGPIPMFLGPIDLHQS